MLTEYSEHLPLTIRQIFYRLVGAYGYPKDDKAYDRLVDMLGRARRAGEVSFADIRDDGFEVKHPLAWDSIDALVKQFRWSVDNFRLDRQHGQPQRLLIAVEAAGMLPQIERVAEPWGIPSVAGGGFDSITAKHGLAELLGEMPVAEVLHHRRRVRTASRRSRSHRTEDRKVAAIAPDKATELRRKLEALACNPGATESERASALAAISRRSGRRA